MNISKIFFVPIIVYGCLSVHSQTSTPRGCESYRFFKGTTTLIVLDAGDSSRYNDIMKATIEKYWTVSPYKIITLTEMYPLLANDEYSILVKNGTERTIRRVKGTSVIKNSEIGLFVAGRGSLDMYVANDAVAYIKLGNLLEIDAYDYKLGGLVQALHYYVSEFLAIKDIDRDNHPKEEAFFLNQYNHQLKDHTLFIYKGDLPEGMSVEDVQKRYKFPVEVVEKERIEEAVLNQEEGVAFLHVYPRAKMIQVIKASGGVFLYGAPSIKYGEFRGKDMAAISKAAE